MIGSRNKIGALFEHRLQKLQNRAARIVTDSPYDAHSETLIKKLGWLTIKQLMDTETVKIVYNALHNEAPKYLKELFHRMSDIQNRELCNSKTDLHIPLLRTSSEQKSFAYRGVCIWNYLTCETKTSRSFSAFKVKLEG